MPKAETVNGGGDEFLIALEGDDVTPETVDGSLLVRLASAYLELASARSKNQSLGFSVEGLRVVNKCAALAFRSDGGEALHKKLLGPDATFQRGEKAPYDKLISVLAEIPPAVLLLSSG